MSVERLFGEAQRLHQRGRLAEAKRHYEDLLKLKSDFALGRLFYAVLLQQSGQILDALTEARQAMADAEAPDASMWVNYGVVLKNAGLLEEAEGAYREALALNPQLQAIKANLSTLYLMTGKTDEAERLCQELTQTLEEPGPWLNLARIAIARDDPERDDRTQAEDCLQRAQDLHPRQPDVYFLRASLRRVQADDPACFEQLQKTLALQPAHPEAWQLLQALDPEVLDLDFVERSGGALAKTGVQHVTMLTAAVDLCRKHLLWDPLDALEALLRTALDAPLDKAPGTSAGFTLLGAKVPQRGHRKASAVTWRQLFGRRTPLEPRTLEPRTSERPIRVGFLSSDLRGHAIGHLIVGLLESLPKGPVTWYAYNNSFSDESDSRTRMRESVDRFINIAPLSDAEVAERIHDDAIDIVIDLNGMTRDTRAQVLAYRPAPIQITWLGMPGTLGAGDAVHYVIGDAWTTPASLAEGFDEHILQLPRSYQPNDHRPPDLSLAGRRADHGLPDEAVVLCCFNQHYKLSPDTVTLWCQILNQVEGSVLWLMDVKSAAQRERLHARFVSAGIDIERLILAGHKPQAEHIARLSHADLVLDTWPYNAHTTCSDALRAGVPVVTLPGETFASRVAAGILASGDLSDWIADSPQAYVSKAVTFCQQPRAAIDAAKVQVRDTYWASAMVDNARFGQLFEALCLGLYDRHAAGEPACALRLSAEGVLEPLAGVIETAPASTDAAADSLDATPFSSAAPSPAVEPSAAAPPVKAAPLAQGARARLENLRRLQTEVLDLSEPPLLIDVGAAHFDWDRQSFDPLVKEGLLSCLVFEPDPKTFAHLQQQQNANRRYVDQAVGDGQDATLYLCNGPHMNSLLKPNAPVLEGLMGYQTAKVIETLNVPTVRLDDVPQALGAAMIKLDTQGTELSILQHATRMLESVLVIQLETAMLPMYQGQPSLFEVGLWLEQQGFIMHSIAKQQMGSYVCPNSDVKVSAKSQWLEIDPVFIPSPLNWSRLPAERLKQLAFLLHALYRAQDAALRALWTIDQRDGTALAAAYGRYLKEAGFNA